MRPVLFCFGRVAVADALHVESFVDVFEEGKADDAVVCAFVFFEGGGAEGGCAAEGAVYSRWVEDLVYALLCVSNFR